MLSLKVASVLWVLVLAVVTTHVITKKQMLKKQCYDHATTHGAAADLIEKEGSPFEAEVTLKNLFQQEEEPMWSSCTEAEKEVIQKMLAKEVEGVLLLHGFDVNIYQEQEVVLDHNNRGKKNDDGRGGGANRALQGEDGSLEPPEDATARPMNVFTVPLLDIKMTYILRGRCRSCELNVDDLADDGFRARNLGVVGKLALSDLKYDVDSQLTMRVNEDFLISNQQFECVQQGGGVAVEFAIINQPHT